MVRGSMTIEHDPSGAASLEENAWMWDCSLGGSLSGNRTVVIASHLLSPPTLLGAKLFNFCQHE